MGDSKPPVYGTSDLATPVSRADFERGLRSLHISDLDLREAVLKLAAQVVALTDEMTRRIDGVEPSPAPRGTPATPATHTVEETVAALVPSTLDLIRGHDAMTRRTLVDEGPPKTEVEPADVPCAELIPLCKARCCTFTFSLSTQDLDEGVIRWDYGQPYLIRQRASDGYCVHNDPSSRACTVHAHRPRVCRTYDCRDDTRIWQDFERRIPAAEDEPREKLPRLELDRFDLIERVKLRTAAMVGEARALSRTYADADARLGPDPAPKPPQNVR